jgi:uncharacterized protein YukE
VFDAMASFATTMKAQSRRSGIQVSYPESRKHLTRFLDKAPDTMDKKKTPLKRSNSASLSNVNSTATSEKYSKTKENTQSSILKAPRKRKVGNVDKIDDKNLDYSSDDEAINPKCKKNSAKRDKKFEDALKKKDDDRHRLRFKELNAKDTEEKDYQAKLHDAIENNKRSLEELSRKHERELKEKLDESAKRAQKEVEEVKRKIENDRIEQAQKEIEEANRKREHDTKEREKKEIEDMKRKREDDMKERNRKRERLILKRKFTSSTK